MKKESKCNEENDYVDSWFLKAKFIDIVVFFHTIKSNIFWLKKIFKSFSRAYYSATYYCIESKSFKWTTNESTSVSKGKKNLVSITKKN